MRSDSSYTTDRRLNKHPFNCTLQPLSSLQKRVSFGDSLRSLSHLGSRENRKYKQIGVRHCRRSRATRAPSRQWLSRLTASRSCPGRGIRRCGSGTLSQERHFRRSRATRTVSALWPSRLIASRSYLGQTIRRSGSGTLSQERRFRRSRATRAWLYLWPSRLTVSRSCLG